MGGNKVVIGKDVRLHNVENFTGEEMDWLFISEKGQSGWKADA